MTHCPLRLRVLFGVLLLATVPPSCVGPIATPPATEKAAENSFRSALETMRAEGRKGAEDILSVYAGLAPDQAPGVADLRHQIIESLAAAKKAGLAHLETAEVDRITVRNPAFWHAWFEMDPRDSSLVMLRCCLLMDAGEVGRASMFLIAGVQTLQLGQHERLLWFAQQARTHWVFYKRMADLRQAEKRWGQSSRTRIGELDKALKLWPADALAAEMLVHQRAGIAAGTIPAESKPVTLAPAARKRVADDLAVLRRCNPVAGLRYSEDLAATQQFMELWDRLTDSNQILENGELTELAQISTQLGEQELGMLIDRAVAARRGFISPAETQAANRTLAGILPPRELEVLVQRIEAGRMPGFRLSRQDPPSSQVLPGLDPAIHPLLAEQALREDARSSFWIQVAGDDDILRAEHLHRRAISNSNNGRYAVALEDITKAIALNLDKTNWAVDRATILSKMGREIEADAAFSLLREKYPKNDFLRHAYAIHQFALGRFEQAESLFRQVPDNSPTREYEVIFGFLAGLRRGHPDKAWLVAQSMKENRWPQPIQRYLSGEIDRDALLVAARHQRDMRTTEQQCEAYLSLAEVALAAGDKDTARREFENSVQSGIVGFIEYDFARRELARLREETKPAGR
jgi:lipoprotein NlpI